MMIEKKVSIVMPCYNEGDIIYSNLKKTNKIVSSFLNNYEIICVNDGSVDSSLEEIKKACKEVKNIDYITYNKNKGKGFALKKGTEKATGEIVVFMDSDLELSPKFIEEYIDRMEKSDADVIIASKLHKNSQISYPFIRRIMSYCYYLFLKILFRMDLKDTQTGLKIFKSNIIKMAMPQLVTNGFAFDIELLSLIHRSGYKIVDAPIRLDFSRAHTMGRINIKSIIKMFKDTIVIKKNFVLKKYKIIKDNKRRIYFFMGTLAELMKTYNIINEAKNRGYDVKIISNGQNIISDSVYLKIINERIKIDLTKYVPKKKTSINYLLWFIRTRRYGIKVLKKELQFKDRTNNIMLVQGDTLTTLMGSQIARKVRMKYVHVESGLRSYNWLSPFPEEIDRYFSSKHSEINFCQTKEAAALAKKLFKGKAVFTEYNTGIEILFSALKELKEKKIKRPYNFKYFLFAIHRQENLANKDFMSLVINKVLEVSKELHCVFIYHEQTRDVLEKYGLWDKVKKCKTITVIGRQDYISFINIVLNAEFIIGDGCGNQQEFYYLGKPYLIMRTKEEESSEGLGLNAIPFENNFDNIIRFSREYKKYRHPQIKLRKKPSVIVMDNIDCFFEEMNSK